MIPVVLPCSSTWNSWTLNTSPPTKTHPSPSLPKRKIHALESMPVPVAARAGAACGGIPEPYRPRPWICLYGHSNMPFLQCRQQICHTWMVWGFRPKGSPFYVQAALAESAPRRTFLFRPSTDRTCRLMPSLADGRPGDEDSTARTRGGGPGVPARGVYK